MKKRMNSKLGDDFLASMLKFKEENKIEIQVDKEELKEAGRVIKHHAKKAKLSGLQQRQNRLKEKLNA